MIIGEYYNVLCLFRYRETNKSDIDEQVLWMDLDDNPYKSKVIKEYIPVIDHPHNDIENGQKEVHYHIDDRFYSITDTTSYMVDIRPQIKNYEGKEYKQLQCLKSLPSTITPTSLISKSKLKHKCIHKGKCPHRGYDLSNEIAINGVITCPLHGLQFDSKSKQITAFN